MSSLNPENNITATVQLPKESLCTTLPSFSPTAQDFNTHLEIPFWVKDLYSKMDDNSKQMEIMKHEIIDRNMQLQSSLDTALNKIKELELINRNSELQSSLDNALNKIKELEATALRNLGFPNNSEIDMGSSQLTGDTLNLDPNPSSSVRTTASSEQSSTPNTSSKSSQKSYESRSLTSAPKGFQYIYFRSQRQVKTSIMRFRLSALGINNNHVSHIHYPYQDVAAFLVRNEYASIFTFIFAEYNIRSLSNSDTLGAGTLRNPNPTKWFTAETQNERLDISRRIHNCTKITQKMKYS